VEAIAMVTALALLQVFVFAFLVGKARVAHGVDAPAMSGHAEFERAFRVHQNTVEQLIIVIPGMWIFGTFVHVMTAAGLGLLFVISRLIYRRAYLADPKSRSMGFTIGAICTVTLILGSLIGPALRWYQG